MKLTVCEKYKAEHVIIPLLRSCGVSLEEVKAELAYRNANSQTRFHKEMKFITNDELMGAETMWNEV